MSSSLDELVQEKRTRISDRASNAAESLLGVVSDILAGLNPAAIVINRGINFSIALGTGHWYGKVLDKAYERTDINQATPFFKKYFCDLIAFNAVQTPLYVVSTYIATSIVSSDPFLLANVYTALKGGSIVAGISLGTSLLKAWYTNASRRYVFKVPTSIEKSSL